MDAQRFGRALGVGARATAKALLQAADAAASPSPAPQAAPRTPNRKVQAGPAIGALKRGSQRFGQAMWQPAARAGGVLWYELTGSFFALFALAAAFELWRRRLDFGGAPDARRKVWAAFVMLALFGWFTVSSFLRARRRARR